MKIFKCIVAAYLVVSLALSVAVSAFDQYGEGNPVIEHRAPFLVLDLTVSTVDRTDESGRQWGHSKTGELVGYGIAGYPEGLHVVTLDVFNPLTSWFDDIVASWDVLTFD